MNRKAAQGFTVLEVLVSIAIIAVLAAIVYAETGPMREKARQNICMGNLHQLTLALAMYRADYNGNESGTTPMEDGFPLTTIRSMLPYTKGNLSVFYCPDDPRLLAGAKMGVWWMGYQEEIWWPGGPMGFISATPWSQALNERGDAFPFFLCYSHDRLMHPLDRPVSDYYVIAGRLDGSAQVVHVPLGAEAWRY